MISINLPPDLLSDGCSFIGPLKLFKGILDADKYTPYCREHDFLIRYRPVHWFKANTLLGKRIVAHGMPGILQAPFYFAFTTIYHPMFGDVHDMPEAYKEYYDYYVRCLS